MVFEKSFNEDEIIGNNSFLNQNIMEKLTKEKKFINYESIFVKRKCDF